MRVVTCEKPSVAREFAKVLSADQKGDGYYTNGDWYVTWCVGHLVTLAMPEEYDEDLKNWRMDTLPFLPRDYKYRIIDEVKKQFYVIKKLYKEADTIYYAGDAGREGLYIQMLVRQEAGVNPNVTEKVVWIDSQTESEIKRGVKEAKPLSAYKDLADSGYLRAIEDYALGINITRALTLKYQKIANIKSVAVGRVMTTVLGMIVRREREIENFVPTDFYKIQSMIHVNGVDIIATWKTDPKSPLLTDGTLYNETGFRRKSDAADFIESLGRNVMIEDVSIKEEKKFAPFLYNLTDLQATCSKLLHISPDQTLEIAQSLYEKKLITYPRTSSRALSTAVAVEIGKNLSGLKRYNGEIANYVDEIFSHGADKNIVNTKYTDDEKVTDHYALIPTGENMGEVSRLNGNEAKVYDLIVRRFISIFLPPAMYQKVTITEKDTNKGERFYANGSTLLKPGYLVCVGIPNEKNALPNEALDLVKGDEYAAKYGMVEGKTTPPSRYTSGSMVTAMENAGNLIEDEDLRAQIKGNGIGTTATRAETIKKLIRNNYINLNTKTQVLTPAPLGNAVFEIVNDSIPELLVPEMTAKWERGLDRIADGSLTFDKYMITLNNYIETQVQKIKDATIDSELTKVITGFGCERDSVGASAPKKVTTSDVATYLDVPFDDKDEVKALGARWDGNKKSWYVPSGKDTAPFAKWINGNGTKSVKKIYLKVPFDDKNQVKALGARWDGDKKSWYIMSNADTSKFKQWM